MPPVPHGFYPALTHFTDAITALPREFRRHSSLLKEVDAKAWALEENLLQLLQYSSESQPVPHPPHPAPIVGGVVREDFLPKVRVDFVGFGRISNWFFFSCLQDLAQPPETTESKNRRLLLDRVRQNLSDLMMTADEKNHVISNANEELDRQIVRLDTVFPYIAGEISEEARLGSLDHWAYSNKSTAKTTTTERPRREAVSQRRVLTHAFHEADASTRSEARREAVLARKQRRAQVDMDYEDTRPGARKTAGARARGDTEGPKRRKVERPIAADSATPMERSASSTNNRGGVNSKDAAEKKRSRAPNPNTAAARKKPIPTSNAGSPVMAPSPLVGTFNAPGTVANPGPNATARPQGSRTQQNAGQTSNARARPMSSASNRQSNNKPTDSKSMAREGGVKNELAGTDAQRGGYDGDALVAAGRREDLDTKSAGSVEPEAKGRSSKTSTPVMGTFAESINNNQSRSRPTRSTDPAPAKRTQKKTALAAQPEILSEEESLHEGDDEDEEGEPRYCYCNEVSFGEMVACDNDACPREWFHLSCVGLTKPPGKNGEFYIVYKVRDTC